MHIRKQLNIFGLFGFYDTHTKNQLNICLVFGLVFFWIFNYESGKDTCYLTEGVLPQASSSKSDAIGDLMKSVDKLDGEGV